MTTQLEPRTVGDSVLFRVKTYDTDGVTLITPVSATCSVYGPDGDTAVVTDAAGTTGSGYAQYPWTGAATAGLYRAVLNVVLSAGFDQSEEFFVSLIAKPPPFTTDLDTDIGAVRMELGDDTQGAGVLPNDANLSDAQIQKLMGREGSVMRAVAAACELLARRWANVADMTLGPHTERLSQVAEQWEKRAAALRAQYGGDGAGAFAIGTVRSDGYSDNAGSASEYAEA